MRKRDKDETVVDKKVKIGLKLKKGEPYLESDLFALLSESCDVVSSATLGKAFEPEQRFENTDGSQIVFNEDYFGDHRGIHPLPGPFADVSEVTRVLFKE